MKYSLSATKKTIIRKTEERNEYQATVISITKDYILGERKARGKTRGQYLLITAEGDRLDARKKEIKKIIKDILDQAIN